MSDKDWNKGFLKLMGIIGFILIIIGVIVSLLGYY